MIKIEVDEAYAFDYLAILEIKRKNSTKDLCTFNYQRSIIIEQIGSHLFEQIIMSDLYRELVKINQSIYDMIDLIRQDYLEMDARVVDDANMTRFNLKRKLQDEFFMNELIETKRIYK
jgi:hypothetical protein